VEFDVLDFDDLKERHQKPQYSITGVVICGTCAITTTIAG